MTGRAATVPLLHRFLGVGLIFVAAVCLVLRYLGIPPVLKSNDVRVMIGYALSAVGGILTAIALVKYKPRVPDRPSAQSVDEYWSRTEVGTKVIPVWFLLEGASTTTALGYLITGEVVPAIAAGSMIVAFWLCGPNAFAKP